MNEPFFIIGSGRSGTTLLRMILASHSRISVPPETWYLLRMGELLDADRPLTRDEANRVVKIMTGHYRWPDMKIDAGSFAAKVADLNKPYLRDIVELVYLEHLKREGKQRWGDKTPGYFEIVPQLTKLFPGAKFIHFTRDGRDVAKSFQALRWSGSRLHDNAKEWLDAMNANAKWQKSEFAPQIFQARYEDLVLNTEETTRRLCAFLGEEFEPQMLAWQDNVDNLMPAREAHIHRSLKESPDAKFIFRWKTEMTTREMLISEAFMGKHLATLGYERRFNSPSWQPVFAAVRMYCRAILPIVDFPQRAVRLVAEKMSGPQKVEKRSRAGS